MSSDSERDAIERALTRDAATWRDGAPPAGSTCVDAETLAAWADGSLPAVQAAQVEAHLADCARCQEMAAVFTMTEPPFDFAQGKPVVARAIAAQARAPRLARWWLPLAGGAIAATLLLFAVNRPEDASLAELQPTALPSSAARATAPDRIAPAPESTTAKAEPPAPKPQKQKKVEPKIAPAPAAAPAPPPPAPQMPPLTAPTQLPVTALPGVPVIPSPKPLTFQTPPATSQQVTVSAAPPVVDTKRTSTGATVARDIVENIPSARDPWRIINMTAEPGVVLIITPATGALRDVNAGGSASGRQVSSGGRGGGASAAPAVVASAAWRVISQVAVEWQLATQTTVATLRIEDPSIARIVGGASPSERVCWLVAPDAVWLTTNADVFKRVSAPAGVVIKTITADDALHARITGSDGRRYATSDGGKTWVPET